MFVEKLDQFLTTESRPFVLSGKFKTELRGATSELIEHHILKLFLRSLVLKQRVPQINSQTFLDHFIFQNVPMPTSKVINYETLTDNQSITEQ